jgi:hypothetical protein
MFNEKINFALNNLLKASHKLNSCFINDLSLNENTLMFKNGIFFIDGNICLQIEWDLNNNIDDSGIGRIFLSMNGGKPNHPIDEILNFVIMVKNLVISVKEDSTNLDIPKLYSEIERIVNTKII